jgi:uncharacterized membrane protein
MIEAMLLGAATGMRSTAGLGAVVLTRGPTLPSALRGRAAPPVAVLAISSELVIDKLPTTPSRLAPPGLIARVLLAGVAAAVVSRSTRRGVAGRIGVAMASAALSANVMHDARAALGRRWPDAIVGAAEDVIALSTAGIATRWATR